MRKLTGFLAAPLNRRYLKFWICVLVVVAVLGTAAVYATIVWDSWYQDPSPWDEMSIYPPPDPPTGWDIYDPMGGFNQWGEDYFIYSQDQTYADLWFHRYDDTEWNRQATGHFWADSKPDWFIGTDEQWWRIIAAQTAMQHGPYTWLDDEEAIFCNILNAVSAALGVTDTGGGYGTSTVFTDCHWSTTDWIKWLLDLENVTDEGWYSNNEYDVTLDDEMKNAPWKYGNYWIGYPPSVCGCVACDDLERGDPCCSMCKYCIVCSLWHLYAFPQYWDHYPVWWYPQPEPPGPPGP